MEHLALQIGYADHGPHHGWDHFVRREQGTDCWLLEYCHEGSAWVELSDHTFQLQAGDWIAFPPGVRQHYARDPAWRHTWLCFIPRPHWHDWLQWPEIGDRVGKLHMESSDMRQACDELLNEGQELKKRHWPRRDDILLNHIERILLYLDTWNPQSQTALLDQRIRQAVDMICAAPEEHLSINDLAEAVNLSPSRFAHLFRDTLGLTPMKYQEQQRLRRAKEMLTMTRLPISQIAYACGYEDPLYFSRIFKKNEALSPKDYRSSLH